jgi:DNA repair exonuclease SbcCD ATPase subunit
MHLTELDIRQLPGIDPICLRDFKPGVNFIVGPNAIGKSSLIRALHYVLAGYRPGDPSDCSISATFEHGQVTWVGSRNGRDITWQRDGETSPPPTLPGNDVLHCYWLRAETLLVPSDADDAALRQRLREALAGGINLEIVRRLAGLEAKPFPNALYKDWQAACRVWESTERDYAALESQRQQLPALEAEQAQARQAREQLERLRLAAQLQQASQSRRDAELACAQFPDELQRFNGSEKDWADTLENDQQRLSEQARALAIERHQYQSQLEATGLATQTPSTALITQARAIIEDLRDLDQHRQQAAAAITQARSREQLSGFGLGTLPDPLPTFTPAQIDELGEALREHSEAKLWQARTQPTNAQTTLFGRILLTVAGAGGALAAVSGWLITSPGALAGGIITVFATLLAGLVPRLRQSTPQPSTAEAVHATQSRLNTCIDKLGLNGLDFSGLGLTQFMALTRALTECRAAEQAAQAQHAHYDQAYERQAQALQTLISDYAEHPSGDLSALRAAVDDLSERRQNASALAQSIATLAAQQQALEERQSDNQQARAALYSKANVALDDRSALNQRIDQHARYTQAQAALEKARLAEAQLEASLQQHPSLVTWAKQALPADIETAITECTDVANRLDTLDSEIAQLKATLNQTGSDGALTKAMASAHALEAELQSQQARYIQAHLGDWLLNDVEQTYRRSHEPTLLREAKERFERFTQTQWSLEVGADHEPVARDLRTRAIRPLSALSSGTRMQLLLAARLAWAHDQERGATALPLALDEALTHTDQQRFAQAVDSLETLSADDNRQIFYLSARHEDATRWAQYSRTAPHIIDLGVLRGRADQADVAPEIIQPTPPPRPDAMSASAYAQALSVPPINLADTPSAIHCFYLFADDLDTLYWLLADYHIRQLGPLAAWLQRPAGKAATTRYPRLALGQRVDIAQAWHALARQGLGKPVERQVLERSQILTDTMLERVTAQAKAHHGNAETLIDALYQRAIPRLNNHYIDALKDWLSEQGFLDTRPILSDAQITATLLADHGHDLAPALIQQLSASLAAGAAARKAPST